MLFSSYLRLSILITTCASYAVIYPANIIFDMNGVLSYQDKAQTVLAAGPITVARLMLASRTIFVRSLLMKTLHAVPVKVDLSCTATPTDELGRPMPNLMIAWMRGEVSGKAAMQKIEVFLKQDQTICQHNAAKKLVLLLSEAIFLPDRFIGATRLYKKSIALVKACKNSGHRIYLLTNWDKESFALLRKKHPAFCTLFDGTVVSGVVGMLKPEKEIYAYLLDTYDLDANDTIFIDDQAINVTAARQAGITAFVCKPTKSLLSRGPNVSDMRRQLNNWLQLKSNALVYSTA